MIENNPIIPLSPDEDSAYQFRTISGEVLFSPRGDVARDYLVTSKVIGEEVNLGDVTDEDLNNLIALAAEKYAQSHQLRQTYLDNSQSPLPGVFTKVKLN